MLKGGRGTALDLTRGKRVDVPPEFQRWDQAQLAQWCIDNGVDVFFESPEGVVGNRPLLILRCWKVSAIGAKRLEDATNDEIDKSIASIRAGQVRPYGAWPLPPRGENAPAYKLDDRELGHYAVPSVPLTAVVETQKGQAVLLEISEVRDGTKQVKIHHKLVRSNSRAEKAPGAVSESPIPGVLTVQDTAQRKPANIVLPVCPLLAYEDLRKELRVTSEQTEKLEKVLDGLRARSTKSIFPRAR